MNFDGQKIIIQKCPITNGFNVDLGAVYFLKIVGSLKFQVLIHYLPIRPSRLNRKLLSPQIPIDIKH